jgi:uncharacterized protein YaeQ
MKKSKNTKEDNKRQLNEYLLDFHPSKISNILNIFEEEDFNCGYFSFRVKMKRKISMPKIGKSATNYWIYRGWSEEEASIKRIKIPKDPESSPMNVAFWTKRGFSKKESLFKIRSQRKLNVEYWINKGYSEEISKIKQTEYQKDQSLKFKIKRNSNPENYNDINTNQLGYWINLGYSEEESNKKVTERQTTFSKKICIDKYGEDVGLKRWQMRQDKWIDSLILSDYNLSDGKSFGVKERIKKFNIDNLIDSIDLKNKDLYKKLFYTCETIEDFVNEYSNFFKEDNDEITLYKIVRPIFTLKILQEYYSTNKDHILSLLIPKIARIKTKYSNISWFNGHICRSDGEYIISNFLFKNDIKYTYEKVYENSKMRCDFYLNDYGLYIEFMGMKPISYKNKINFLNTNNINYISSDNVSDLKTKILNYVNSKN